MKYTFKRTPLNIEAWQDMNLDLKENLNEILAGNCIEEEIKTFCYFAVAAAKPLKHDNTMVFWGYDEPNTMPSDARCEFFYLPTYLTVQIMLAAALQVPTLMADKRFTATLEYGLNGCCGRNLMGHGIDNEEFVDNVKAFLQAGYAEFDMRYPRFNRKFHRLIKRAVSDLVNNNQIDAPSWFLGHYDLKENETLYIAYGSNMNRKQMACRCPGSELVGIGVLPKAKLEFYLHATVEKSEKLNDKVPVAVWRITEEHEAELDYYEGVAGHYYKKETADVVLNNGCKLKGLIYVMEKFRRQPVREDYYEGIESAYTELGLSRYINSVLEPAKERNLNLL